MTKDQLKNIVEGAVNTNGLQLISGETLQETLKTIIDNVPSQDEVVSGIKGTATQSNAPTVYTVETYPNGLFERYVVSAPITSPNSWGNIAVTAGEIAANTVFFNVTNGVVTKELSVKPVADPAKLPLYSAIKSANIVAGTQFVDDENGDIMYRVMSGQTLAIGELPANFIGTKVRLISVKVAQVLGTSTTEAISQKAATDEINKKLSLVKSKNLFNKAAVTDGKYVLNTTGYLVDSATWSASDYIEITPSTTYTISHTTYYAFYTAAMAYISGGTSATFDTPANAKYIRMSARIADKDVMQFEVGSAKTTYDTFTPKISNDNIKDLSIPNSKLEPIAESKLLFIPVIGEKSKNLFNKDTITTGNYLSIVNGALVANAAYMMSDYIEVLPSTYYNLKVNHQLVFYDANKAFISGYGGLPPVLTPSNAKYIRISNPLTFKDTQQVELGKTFTGYDSFGTKIKEIEIPSDYRKVLKAEVISDVKKPSSKAFGESLKNPFLRTNVRLIGDSITYGLGATTGNSWASLLAAYIAANFNKDHVVALNDKRISYYGYSLNYEGSTVTTKTGSFTNMSGVAGKLFEYDFFGTNFGIYFTSGSDCGIFEIYVDDVLAQTVDTYEATTVKGKEVNVTGLTNVYHHVEVRLTDTKSASSSGKTIKIEGLRIPKTALVVNSGVSGITSAGTATNLVTTSDDFVFCMAGTNDRHMFPTIGTTKANHVKIYNEITANGVSKPIFMTANPTTDEDTEKNFKMGDVEIAVSGTAELLSVPYINHYGYMIDYADLKDLPISTFLSDGLHPNNAGYKVMFNNILKTAGLSLKM